MDAIEDFQNYILAFYAAVCVSYANAVTASFIFLFYWDISFFMANNLSIKPQFCSYLV